MLVVIEDGLRVHVLVDRKVKLSLWPEEVNGVFTGDPALFSKEIRVPGQALGSVESMHEVDDLPWEIFAWAAEGEMA